MGEWKPEDETCADHAAICPACGYEHGDCWEWLEEGGVEVDYNCSGCGAALVSEAHYSVSYTTTLSSSPTTEG